MISNGVDQKDSGVDWIGGIPQHWEMWRLKYLTFNWDSRRIPISAEDRAEIQGDIPYWGANGVIDHVEDHLIDEEVVLLGEDGAPFYDALKPVAFYSNEKIWPNNHIHILKVKENLIISKFLVHSLNIVDYHQYITGSTRDKLTQTQMKEIQINLPPILEQKIISNYLDKKTTEIDHLIEAKQRHLALLEDYHRVLIHEAVTKGIDPSVSMKDSEIVRLGKYPNHWSLRRLKTFSSIKPSNVDKKSVEGQEEVLLCNYNEVYQNEFITNDMDFMKATASDKQIEELTIQKGDIIITKDSETPLEIGIPAYVKDNLDGVVCGYHLCLIKPNPTIADPKYIFRALQSQFIAEQYSVSANGITRFGLKVSAIGNAIFPLPPTIQEQKEIVKFIDEKCDAIIDLSNKIRRQIEKLKEYRQALISEAVTGKIPIKRMEEEIDAKNSQ